MIRKPLYDDLEYIMRRFHSFFAIPVALSNRKLLSAATVIFFAWVAAGTPAFGGDLVLNYGFELQNTVHWIETGNVPPLDRGVSPYDVTGNGKNSWAYYQHPGDGFSGGVDQILHVQAGVTYTVEADFCYHNC